ncbi:GDP-mannose pyrophosphorylase B [Loa loa]|uniref:mannose-1-phosphate guanylyltransferase n=1 Tax=Loa loa TaxID=7209 RepID=A0A1I7VUF6_LOALO|nr:GDP-mannose pyrophosphorylase B [Loa loa]EFO14965.1 GDP-mannose pyrophosphorylase B [Loa loa]
MKALILVGGYGTRLRPLTLTQPKPLIEFANKPMLFHQIEALVAAGVDTVILAINYRAKALEEEIASQANYWNITVHFSVEKEPLGTAGALSLAKGLLKGEEPFLVLNSDIICDFPFRQMIDFHVHHQHEGTIAVTKATEPSKYGVCIFDEKTGKVDRFVEKPSEYMGNNINAGLYVLSPRVLNRIPLRPTSMEKEIFPQMVKDGNLYTYVLQDFWMDIGQPQDFLIGTRLYLHFVRSKHPEILSKDHCVRKDVMIHHTARIGEHCIIGPNAVIGSGVQIHDGVCLRDSTVLSNSIIHSHSWINGSIIGRKCVIGSWVRIDNTCIIGDDVIVEDELYLNGARVLPHKAISASVLEPDIIM